MTMNVEPIRMQCCRWQYLFPYGLVEEYAFADGTVEKTTYNDRTLKAFMDSWETVNAYQRQRGMPIQPRPVSVNHGHIRGESEQDRRMVGKLWAIRTHVEDDGIPKGLWGLVEWGWEGQSMVSGSYNMLSPTNATILRMEDGTVIRGQHLIEVGLVNNPFFVTIGTASDFVSCEVWPIPDIGRPIEGWMIQPPVTQAETLRDAAQRYLSLEGQVMTRNARLTGDTNMSQKTREENTTVTVEPPAAAPAASEPSGEDKMRSMVERYCSERGYMTRQEVMDLVEARMKTMSMTPPSMTPDDSQNRAAGDPKSEDDAATRAKPSAQQTRSNEATREEQIRVKFRNACWADAEKLVMEGKLLPRNQRAYVDAREAGEDTSKLMVDAAMSRSQGTVGSTPAATPAKSAEPWVQSTETVKLMRSGVVDPAELATKLRDSRMVAEREGREIVAR